MTGRLAPSWRTAVVLAVVFCVTPSAARAGGDGGFGGNADGDEAVIRGGTGAGVKASPVGGPGAVEHLYRRTAKVEVTLTRTFEVTYTAPGGVTGTLPAPGVSNTSAPTPLEVGEIQTLVTDGR